MSRRRRRTWSAQAAVFGPKELARLGRQILDVVAPAIAEEAEARRLADLEARAQLTRLTMRRLGDGTTRISGRFPDARRSVRDLLEASPTPARTETAAPTTRPGGSVHPAALPNAGWVRRCASSWSPSTPSGSRSTAATPRRCVITMPLDSLRRSSAPRTSSAPVWFLVRIRPATHHRRPGPTARVHREDHSRRPRRRQHPLGPGPSPPTVQPRAAQGPPDPRQDLPRRGLRRPGHLVRRPPRRTPGQPAAAPTWPTAPALQPSPPPRPRHRLPHRPTPQRRHQVPPTQIGPHQPKRWLGSRDPSHRSRGGGTNCRSAEARSRPRSWPGRRLLPERAHRRWRSRRGHRC